MKQDQQRRPIKSSISMVKVAVCDEPIDAGFDGEAIWVSVRRVCEVLGLDEEPQRKKLRRKPWAVTSLKEATGPDGKKYRAFCISHKFLPMWLATIEPTRATSPSVERKLARFQIEAAQVLAAHFYGTPESGLTPELLALLRTVPELLREVRELREGRSPASVIDDPPIGKGAAQHRIMAPLHEIADLIAEATGCTDRKAINSLRTSEELALRNEIEFCFATDKNWDILPTSHLPEVEAAISRRLGVARLIAKIAAVHGFRQLRFDFGQVA
jgi:hypothetical protein